MAETNLALRLPLGAPADAPADSAGVRHLVHTSHARPELRLIEECGCAPPPPRPRRRNRAAPIAFDDGMFRQFRIW